MTVFDADNSVVFAEAYRMLASKVSQIESNIAATDISLTQDQMTRLNAVSAPPAGFSSILAAPGIRRMVFGGHEVVAWGE